MCTETGIAFTGACSAPFTTRPVIVTADAGIAPTAATIATARAMLPLTSDLDRGVRALVLLDHPLDAIAPFDHLRRPATRSAEAILVREHEQHLVHRLLTHPRVILGRDLARVAVEVEVEELGVETRLPLGDGAPDGSVCRLEEHPLAAIQIER